jgi:hypothetical protein
VRIIISSIVPGHTFYADIDVAFPRPLDWILSHRSFVYRWETFAYANSALMSVTADSDIKGGALLRLLAQDGSVLPWVLFNDVNCRACDLDILPCDRLDLQWSRVGPNGPHMTPSSTGARPRPPISLSSRTGSTRSTGTTSGGGYQTPAVLTISGCAS